MRHSLLTAAGLAALLAGCTLGPAYERPAAALRATRGASHHAVAKGGENDG